MTISWERSSVFGTTFGISYLPHPNKPVSQILKSRSDRFLGTTRKISVAAEEAHEQLRVLLDEANRRYDNFSEVNALISKLTREVRL